MMHTRIAELINAINDAWNLTLHRGEYTQLRALRIFEDAARVSELTIFWLQRAQSSTPGDVIDTMAMIRETSQTVLSIARGALTKTRRASARNALLDGYADVHRLVHLSSRLEELCK